MKFGISESNILQAKLVIIGGGGSGLSAALSAAEQGITDIVVLEQRGGLGGNTARATGLFACESQVQAREKITADKDKLFKKSMEWSHWSKVNPRIVRAFLNKSGDTIHWLEGKGLEFSIVPFFPNQEPRVWHVARGKGAELTKVLAQKCREMGVRLVLRCCAKKILREAEGKISGVLAFDGDREIKIRTDSVIIASGGFAGNNDLLQKYCPDYYESLPLRGLALNGDGLLMAQEVGAEIDSGIAMLIEGPRVDLNLWPLKGLEREPETLWVNKKGERFTDESTGDHPFASVNAILMQPERVSFTLFDTSIKQKVAEKTGDLDQTLKLEAAKGRVKISDSWDEIAAWVGANPDVLEATIRQYNDFTHRGYDESFAKDRRYLWPLLRPPYYAVKCFPACLDTLGGIRINEHMQVLDSLRNPILGLYAGGVVTGGWQSEHYCGDLSGSAFGYAINSGRIAGEQAAEFIRQND